MPRKPKLQGQAALRGRCKTALTVVADSDFFLVVLNAPLRVKGGVGLTAPALDENLLPLVVDREVCDELLGESLRLSELLVVGHQSRKLDLS